MRSRPKYNGMESVFTFLLLGMFAVSCVFLTVLGVRVYRNGAGTFTRHNTDWILSSYIRSMVRGMDREGAVSVETADGVDMITVTETYDSEAYVTRLYCSDGKLREWFSQADHAFKPEDGAPICDAAGMSARLEDGLITADITEEEGAQPMRVAVRVFCAGP